MILAIVGSRKFHKDPVGTQWAVGLISRYYNYYRREIECVVSGGAEGIDTIAIDCAAWRGIPWAEFLPVERNWEAYKERDIIIAKVCTHLLCIRHYKATTYGSGWTADYAKSLGKNVIKKEYRNG